MIKLKKGDIVDIVAPASFTDSVVLIKACEEMRKWGLVPRTFIDFEAYHPFHSDEDQVRLQDLKRAILAPDSKVIWSIRGGYGSARLIDGLKKMKKPLNKKIFIGFSDLTSLHFFFTQTWGWETIHGPMISSFSNPDFDKKAHRELKSIFYKNEKKLSYKLTPINDSALNTKKIIATGITGGNLALVQTSIGTSYEIKCKNKILILEDISERGYQIDRMLNHLQASGILKGVKAILFGDFSRGDEPTGENFTEFAITRFALSSKIPIFKSDDFGHGNKNRPIIFNKKSEISNLVLTTKF